MTFTPPVGLTRMTEKTSRVLKSPNLKQMKTILFLNVHKNLNRGKRGQQLGWKKKNLKDWKKSCINNVAENRRVRSGKGNKELVLIQRE